MTEPIGLLRALADVLAPRGEMCSKLTARICPATHPGSRFTSAGDVYARDEFVYWGFSAEGLRRLARIVGLDEWRS